MKIDFIEKNYDIGERLKRIITKKIEKLDRYFDDNALAKVVCKQENKTYKLELSILSKKIIYRAEVCGENMYENIDFAMPKIERQIIKQYEKHRDRFRTQTNMEVFEFWDKKPEEEKNEVIKKKVFQLEPRLLEDAIDEMESVGHNFYVFLNAETGKICSLYKRNDKKLGLIEYDY